MASAWGRAKAALSMNLCIHAPHTLDGEAQPSSSRVVAEVSSPTSPTTASSGHRLSSSGSRSSKRICAICLVAMKPGRGHALFTAECSHTFHFHCISSNVRHGNYVCPVCRTKWKEIPSHAPPISDANHGRSRVNPINWSQEDGHMTVARRLPRVQSANNRHQIALSHASEPVIFNDDESVHMHSETHAELQHGCARTVEIKTFSEYPAIHQSSCQEDFAILIHLKAPNASSTNIHSVNSSSVTAETSRTPIDLVTVLDISGSMAGTKLALVKRAMGFVIQHLGPSDRLSVVCFSSTARRLFHLRRMSSSGRQQALQAINSLISGGGTNIADGIRKGAKVIEERRQKNQVCSIILLSDGQDTYTISSIGTGARDYSSLVQPSRGSGHQIPVHAFGFGTDHDAAALHSIAEISSGTFSFIEAENVIQDAFAQCIGGLLSVVVQDMRVGIQCVDSGIQISSIKSGSYPSQVVGDGRSGSIEVGDLYADEERDFLVSVKVPPAPGETMLLKVGCSYRDPVTNEDVKLQDEEVIIRRPELAVSPTMSIEVDRERNRIQAAEDMSAARVAAERGELSEAVSILEQRRRMLAESAAGRSGDGLCLALDLELKEMQERMANRQRYEASGRAYVLSGLSSHSWQRATTRGDSTESTTFVHSYQTPSMVDMLQRSQVFPLSRSPAPPVRPTKSFSGHSCRRDRN